MDDAARNSDDRAAERIPTLEICLPGGVVLDPLDERMRREPYSLSSSRYRPNRGTRWAK